MNQVRIVERKRDDALKGHKYTFLRNRENLSDKQEKSLNEMITLYPTLGEAYRLKVLFNDLGDAREVSSGSFSEAMVYEVETARFQLYEVRHTVRGIVGIFMLLSRHY